MNDPSLEYWISEAKRLRDLYPDFRPSFSVEYRRLIGFMPAMVGPAVKAASSMPEGGGDCSWHDFILGDQVSLNDGRSPEARLERFKQAISALIGLSGRLAHKLDALGIELPDGYSDVERVSFFAVGQNWTSPYEASLTVQPLDCVFSYLIDALAAVSSPPGPDTADTKTDTKKKTQNKRKASAAARLCAFDYLKHLETDPTTKRIRFVEDWVQSKNGVWDGKALSVSGINKMLQANPDLLTPKDK